MPTDAATIGVLNPGGVRAEIFYPATGAEGDGVVTYAEANSVLPFVNNLWTTHLTGAQVKTMLEQQWQRNAMNNIPTRAYLQLSLSDNVDYTFDPQLPEGSRITSITVAGEAVDPAATYKIATAKRRPTTSGESCGSMPKPRATRSTWGSTRSRCTSGTTIWRVRS